jgi:hypothetical protein
MSSMEDRNIQHPDITEAERTGYPRRIERLKKSKETLLTVDLLPFDLKAVCVNWFDREIYCAETTAQFQKELRRNENDPV